MIEIDLVAHQAMKPIRAHGKALPEQMHVSGLIGAPKIPRELVEAVRRSVTIDWTVGTTFVLSSVLSSSVSCASTAIRPIRQERATQSAGTGWSLKRELGRCIASRRDPRLAGA